MANFKTLDDLDDLNGKVALVRCDLNVPMQDGNVSDDTRLRAAIPTLTELADKGAKVLVLSHFGRPKGEDPMLSLSPISSALEKVLGRPVTFITDTYGDAAEQMVGLMAAGDIAVLENTRFNPGETKNDPELAKKIAALGDIYVSDAFSTTHRAHVSTEGLARLLPAYAGRAMEAELKALEAALGDPERPVAAVVGGAKVSC